MKRQSFQKTISTLILGTSALVGSFCAAPATHAYDIAASAVDPSLLPIGIEIAGKRYWTVSEMIEASRLIDAKRDELCGDDPTCKEELPWEQMDELGGIYRALDPFENIHLMLTSINPSANTIKLLYHDEDKMLSRMLGETIRNDISTLYVVWVDESTIGDPSTDTRWLAYDYRYPFHLGSEEEARAATHIIMDESATELGDGWFTPNVEREYYAPNSNLAANAKKWLYFALNAVPDGGHSSGILDYSSCINSPAYADGMECKMMYADDGSYTYFPATPASITSTNEPEPATDPTTEPIAEPDPTTEPTVEPDLTTEPTPEPDPIDDSAFVGLGAATGSTDEPDSIVEPTIEPTEDTAAGQETAKTASISSDNSVSSAPITPDTGEYTKPQSSASELPWWLFVIFGTGILTLIWLFSPKKSKKVRLFSKNVLTKKPKCDKMVSVQSCE